MGLLSSIKFTDDEVPTSALRDPIYSSGLAEEFGRGVNSGLTGAHAGLRAVAGTVGEALGADQFAKNQYLRALELERQAQAEAPRVNSYKQVNDLRSLAQYATGLVGGSMPSMALGVGAGLGARTLGGALLRGTAAQTPIEAGDVAMKQLDDPEAMAMDATERGLRQLGGGVGSAALQSVVPAALAGKLMGRGAQDAAQMSWKQVAGRNALGIPVEGLAEGGGDIIKQQASNENAALDWESVKENTIGGMAAGGAMSTIGTAADLAYRNGPMAADALAQARTSIKDKLAGAKEKTGVLLDEAGDTADGLMQKAKDFYGDAKPKVMKTFDDIAESDAGQKAKNLYERATDAMYRAKNKGEDVLGKIISGEEVGIDLKKAASATTEQLKEMFDFSDNEKFKAVKAAGEELLKSKFGIDEETRAKVAESMSNLGDKASQVFIAKTMKARQAATEKAQRVREWAEHAFGGAKQGDEGSAPSSWDIDVEATEVSDTPALPGPAGAKPTVTEKDGEKYNWTPATGDLADDINAAREAVFNDPKSQMKTLKELTKKMDDGKFSDENKRAVRRSILESLNPAMKTDTIQSVTDQIGKAFADDAINAAVTDMAKGKSKKSEDSAGTKAVIINTLQSIGFFEKHDYLLKNRRATQDLGDGLLSLINQTISGKVDKKSVNFAADILGDEADYIVNNIVANLNLKLGMRETENVFSTLNRINKAKRGEDGIVGSLAALAKNGVMEKNTMGMFVDHASGDWVSKDPSKRNREEETATDRSVNLLYDNTFGDRADEARDLVAEYIKTRDSNFGAGQSLNPESEFGAEYFGDRDSDATAFDAQGGVTDGDAKAIGNPGTFNKETGERLTAEPMRYKSFGITPNPGGTFKLAAYIGNDEKVKRIDPADTEKRDEYIATVRKFYPTDNVYHDAESGLIIAEAPAAKDEFTRHDIDKMRFDDTLSANGKRNSESKVVLGGNAFDAVKITNTVLARGNGNEVIKFDKGDFPNYKQRIADAFKEGVFRLADGVNAEIGNAISPNVVIGYVDKKPVRWKDVQRTNVNKPDPDKPDPTYDTWGQPVSSSFGTTYEASHRGLAELRQHYIEAFGSDAKLKKLGLQRWSVDPDQREDLKKEFEDLGRRMEAARTKAVARDQGLDKDERQKYVDKVSPVVAQYSDGISVRRNILSVRNTSSVEFSIGGQTQSYALTKAGAAHLRVLLDNKNVPKTVNEKRRIIKAIQLIEQPHTMKDDLVPGSEKTISARRVAAVRAEMRGEEDTAGFDSTAANDKVTYNSEGMLRKKAAEEKLGEGGARTEWGNDEQIHIAEVMGGGSKVDLKRTANQDGSSGHQRRHNAPNINYFQQVVSSWDPSDPWAAEAQKGLKIIVENFNKMSENDQKALASLNTDTLTPQSAVEVLSDIYKTYKHTMKPQAGRNAGEKVQNPETGKWTTKGVKVDQTAKREQMRESYEFKALKEEYQQEREMLREATEANDRKAIDAGLVRIAGLLNQIRSSVANKPTDFPSGKMSSKQKVELRNKVLAKDATLEDILKDVLSDVERSKFYSKLNRGRNAEELAEMTEQEVDEQTAGIMAGYDKIKEAPNPKAQAPEQGARSGDVESKKQAAVKLAKANDPRLLKDIEDAVDPKQLQRLIEVLADKAPKTQAMKRAIERLREMIAADESVAYGMQTRKYSLLSTMVHDGLEKAGFAATHDSPIRHEGAFDWRSHQGKGEGNAAFGAGTYLSTADGVHRSYKDQFTAKISKHPGLGLGEEHLARRIKELQRALRDLQKYMGEFRVITWDHDTGVYDIGSDPTDGRAYGDRLTYVDDLVEQVAQELREMRKPITKSPTYHVSVDIKPEQLLDWDKPLSEQSAPMLDALSNSAVIRIRTFVHSGNGEVRYSADIVSPRDPKAFNSGGVGTTEKLAREQALRALGERKGADIYATLVGLLGSQAKASEYLQSLGILGHKYAASGGRNDGHPNYVIYDDSKITTNYVSFSNQQANGPAANAAVRKEVKDYIEKVLGKSVKLHWAKLTHAGDFTRTSIGDIIRLSLHSLNPKSVAYHEALHAFFAQLRDANAKDIIEVIEKAASDPKMVRRLMDRFANQPAVLNQLQDPEERAAYMFQLWAEDPKGFPIATAPRTAMEKIVAFIHRVLGTWSNDQRALHIMEYFHSGEYSKNMGKPNEVRRALMDVNRNGALEKAKEFTMPLYRLGDAIASTGDARIRDLNIPAFTEIVDLIKRRDFSKPIGAGSLGAGAVSRLAVGQIYTSNTSGDNGFIPAARMQATKRLNNLADRLAGYTQTQLDDALESLQSEKPANSAEGRLAAREIKAVLEETYEYMTRAGVKIGNLGPDYFPRVWDTHYISKNEQAFHDMMAPYVQSGEFKGNVTDLILGLTSREGNEFGVETSIPGMQHKKQRLLSFIKAEDAAPFLTKDLYGTLGTYITQATRRAEWDRRFGYDVATGVSRMERFYDDAKAQGATDADFELLEKYFKSVDGTLGDNINPKARRLMGNVMVYQNIRLLPMAAFSMMIDPLGILVRGGTAGEAFNSFKRGMASIPQSYGKKYTPDEAEKLAELLGVVESAMLSNAMGDAYTQGMVGGGAKKVNQLFFKYNAVEGLNRSFRVGATEAAISFIKRHADGKASPHSERWIKELGLSKGDVKILPDGRLAISEKDGLSKGQIYRVHAAVNMWVDGAVLRPNAADKPIWMNDPHWALIAHLKQFVWSFQETILKRVMHETEQGNFRPAMALVSYVPVMIAVDTAKGIIQNGGDVPEWKKDWGVWEYTNYGIERAGLYGVGQYGNDVWSDVQRGGVGIGALAGPTIDQLGDAVQATGGHKEFAPFVLDAMPANALYSNL